MGNNTLRTNPVDADVVDLLRRTRAASGVPEQLEDAATIQLVADLLRRDAS